MNPVLVVLEVIDLVIAFLQNFVMLINVPDVDFTDEYRSVLRYVRFVSLDATFFDKSVPGLPTDARTQFLLISCALPGILVFLALFGLQTKLFILCFFMIVIGLLLVLVTVLLYVIDVAELVELVSGQPIYAFAAAGGGLILVAGIIAAVSNMMDRRRTLAAERQAVSKRRGFATTAEVDEENARGNFEVCDTVVSFFITAAFVVVGLMLLHWSAMPATLGDGETAAKAVGGILLGIGGLLFVWFVLGLWPEGRVKKLRISRLAAKHYMKFILVAFSLFYIPIAANTAVIFNCNTFKCAAGYRLPDTDSIVPVNLTVLNGCQQVDHAFDPVRFSWMGSTSFPPLTCPYDLRLDLLDGDVSRRLEYDRTLRCEDLLQHTIWPAGGIVICVCVLGIPVLYYYLARSAARHLWLKFPILQKNADGTVIATGTFDGCKKNTQSDREHVEAEYVLKVDQSTNIAMYLFAPFEFRWRFWRIVIIIQRLLLVLTTVYVLRWGGVNPSAVAVIAAIVIHVIVTGLLVVTAPYARDMQDRLATVMQVCLSVTSLLAVLLFYSVDIPATALNVFLYLNLVVPLLVFVVGLYLDTYGGKDEEKPVEHGDDDEHPSAAEAGPVEGAVAADGTTVLEVRDEEHEAGQTGPPPSLQSQQSMDKSDEVFNPLSPVALGGGAARSAAVPRPGTVAEDHQGASTDPRFAEAMVPVGPAVAPRQSTTEDDPEWLASAVTSKDRMAQIRRIQFAVDEEINARSRVMLLRYAMVAGVLLIFATGLGVVGILGDDHMLSGPFDALSIQNEFVGYGNWEEFVSNCCCIDYSVFRPSTLPSSLSVIGGPGHVEKWVCRNGRIKERMRQRVFANGASSDGYALRGLCAPAFNVGCTATFGYDTIPPRPTVACSFPLPGELLW